MHEKIKQIIQNSIQNSEVHVFDPMNDSTHFQAVVISSDFEDMTLVQQQQLVMNSLKKEFNNNMVHALGLKTFTPEKWESQKNNYSSTLSP